MSPTEIIALVCGIAALLVSLRSYKFTKSRTIRELRMEHATLMYAYGELVTKLYKPGEKFPRLCCSDETEQYVKAWEDLIKSPT